MAKKSIFSKFLSWRSAAFIIAAGLLLISISIVWAVNLPIPDFESLFTQRVVSQSTKIYDKTGEILLYDVHDNIRRTIVPMSEISDYAKQATIAIEDDEFYSHEGVRPLSFLRAVYVNLLTGGFTQGGSTITQQVVKNAFLTQEKLISRKIKEMVMALKIEKVLSKDEILSIYLNETPYGGSIYGIEEASRGFFGKSAKDLTLPEAAYLAALPQAPTYFSPNGNNREQLEQRKNLTLNKMADLGMITKKEAEEANQTKVDFIVPDEKGIRAPHFVMYVRSYLEEKYGKEAIESGGYKVTTTLDWRLQAKAEEIVKKYGPQIKSNFNANNAGMVIIDPKTGHILAMVGSVDYFNTENDGNFNITLAKRQPGSSFKPFVYAAAFEKGYTPETIVFDLQTEFNTNCSPLGLPETTGADCYMPVNYDNTYAGPITLKNALAQSKNIPAVKVLYLTGLNTALEAAKRFGITTLTDPARYGLTLVLGGGEVSLLELTGAYGVFASEGTQFDQEKIIKIEDSEGNILEENEPKGTKVASENITRIISDILSDEPARIPAFGSNSLLNFPGRDVAVKTGTTNDYRDAWIVGYTPSIVIGAWAGNNDNSPMAKQVAGFIIAPIWNEMMNYYLNNSTRETFINPAPTPQNIKPILRGNWNSSGEVHSILHWVDKNNPLGPTPNIPASDPQYRLWEYPVSLWKSRSGIGVNINPEPNVEEVEN